MMTEQTAAENTTDTRRSHPKQSGRVRSDCQWESIRGTLHEMLMAGHTLGFIAKVFDRSEQTVRRWRDRMYEEMRADAKSMEPRDYALEVMDGLRAARGQAWLGLRTADTPKAKMSALNLYLKATDQLHQFYQTVGAYGQRGAQPLHPANSGASADEEGRGVNMLAEMAKEFLSTLAGERERAGASGPISWDDILGPDDDGDNLTPEAPEQPGAAPMMSSALPGETDARTPSVSNADLNKLVRKRKRPGAAGRG